MKELRDVLRAARQRRAEGRPFALATVVKIGGSTYRRPGARMLVTAEGEAVGTISGGCLEGEVTQHGLDVLEKGEGPRVVTFEETEDEVLGYGTGCGGTVHVMIEDAERAGASNALTLVQACLDERKTGVLATVIEASGDLQAHLGRRLLLLEDGTWRGDDALDDAFRQAIIEEAVLTLEDEKTQIRHHNAKGETAEVLYELVQPPVRLVVFGGGHDVVPVVHFGAALGWHVTVVGSKPEAELQQRFPDADAHVFLMHPEQALDYVRVDDRTAVVVMNHHYGRDRAVLGEVLPLPVPYVGVLGPRSRTDRLLSDLKEGGVQLNRDEIFHLHAPVGLDIGTETPEEIALSIVAEIQAVLHDRKGGRLRERSGAIHAPVPVH